MKLTLGAIIADDLTGATDAAAPFARRGFSAHVLADPFASLPACAQILSISTNSRHDSPRTAAAKVRDLHQRLRRRGIPILFKKIDSTLHGNIEAEAIALMKAGGQHRAVLCPANPAQGRIVQRGQLIVRGKNRGMVRRVIRRKPGRLQVEFPDAATPADLRRLVRVELQASAPGLLIGSAGLAAPLAAWLAGKVRRKKFEVRKGGNRRDRLQGVARPLVCLIGSKNPVTSRQVRALIERNQAIRLPLLLCSPRLLDGLLQLCAALVITVPIHQQMDATILKHLRRLSVCFGKGRISGLVLSGGDTALLACRAFGVRSIELSGEIVPGVALGTIQDGRLAGISIACKPGGFGTRHALSNCAANLA